MHPSKFLSAADLNEEKVTATISSVEMEEMQGGDSKPVIYFEELEKGMVANKTNCTTISALYGDDSDEWVGEKVTLFPTYTTFNKQNVACIRIEPKRPTVKKAALATAGKPIGKPAGKPVAAPEPPPADGDDADDIPFGDKPPF